MRKVSGFLSKERFIPPIHQIGNQFFVFGVPGEILPSNYTWEAVPAILPVLVLKIEVFPDFCNLAIFESFEVHHFYFD